MEILKLCIFFLQVPFTPACGYVDFVEESVALEVAYLHLRYGDLDLRGCTLRVEYVWSILYLQNYIINQERSQQSAKKYVHKDRWIKLLLLETIETKILIECRKIGINQ